MMSRHHIERAGTEHAETVARLVAALLLELSGGTRQIDVAELDPTSLPISHSIRLTTPLV